MTEGSPPKPPSVPAALLETIANGHPELRMRVRLTYPFAKLCPFTGEPQPGSTITISYQAGEVLLETKALRHYLASFAGENVYGVRDLEEAAQVIALQCAHTLHRSVHVHAEYHLQSGTMDVEVEADPGT